MYNIGFEDVCMNVIYNNEFKLACVPKKALNQFIRVNFKKKMCRYCSDFFGLKFMHMNEGRSVASPTIEGEKELFALGI